MKNMKEISSTYAKHVADHLADVIKRENEHAVACLNFEEMFFDFGTTYREMDENDKTIMDTALMVVMKYRKIHELNAANIEKMFNELVKCNK